MVDVFAKALNSKNNQDSDLELKLYTTTWCAS